MGKIMQKLKNVIEPIAAQIHPGANI